MTTPSNWTIIRVTAPLWGEFPGLRRIPRTKASDAELWCLFFICAWINRWVNNREAGELRRHCAHYDVTVMPPFNMTRVTLMTTPTHRLDIWPNHVYVAFVFIISYWMMFRLSLKRKCRHIDSFLTDCIESCPLTISGETSNRNVKMMVFLFQ